MPYGRWHKSRPKPGRGPRARDPWHLAAPGGCPGATTTQPEITRRDLRTRSKEIMDAVQSCRSFTSHVSPDAFRADQDVTAEQEPDDQNDYDEHAEHARRTDILQRAEHEFTPVARPAVLHDR